MAERRRRPVMPSSVDEHVSWFDRFAGSASAAVSRAWFFAACVLLVVLWVPTLFFLDVNTSQLLINTATTIVTFLLVALLQNSQERQNNAAQHKANAVAAGLRALMQAYADDPATPDDAEARLRGAIRELQAAVGLEQREST